MVCWFKTRERPLKVQLTGLHFKWNLQNSKKFRSNDLKRRRLTFNLFLCFKSSQKKYLFLFGKVKFTSYYCLKSNQKKYLFLFGKIKFTSYYCLKSNQKKYLFLFGKIKFTSYYCLKSNQRNIYFFDKIKFTSYVNYCWKLDQKKVFIIFLPN